MSDNIGEQLANGPAVPITLTIQRDSGHWVVRAWYHGHTIHDALHPILLGERWLDHERCPARLRWRDLYREVAIVVEELAAGMGEEVHAE